MKTLKAILFASFYGLAVRLLYGASQDLFEVMSITFLFLLPFIIGFLTILCIPYKSSQSYGGAFFKPWLTSGAILIITLCFNIEGMICWAMIFPLFAIAAGLGGVIAFAIKKRRNVNKDFDKWDMNNRMSVSILLVLPILLGAAESHRTQNLKNFIIKKEIVIAAPPEKVWNSLLSISKVNDKKTRSTLSNTMGFPHHLYTTLDKAGIGGKRVAYYEKGLYFEETISKYIPQQLMVLDIKTDPASIPATTLDEHLVIGGKHVDIEQDTYTLEKLANGNSKLTLSSKFNIHTSFNWYAGFWAELLMKDILNGQLAIINQQSLKL